MILGIDPGISGAIAVLTEGGAIVAVHDMPTVVAKVNGKNRTRIVDAELARLVRQAGATLAVVEQVGPMPRDGSQQSFGLGLAYGLARMACAAAGLPVVLVTPATWMKAMKVTASKDGSREMAMRLWPVQSDLFRRVKDDGRAEAALIAFYGRAQWQRQAA